MRASITALPTLTLIEGAGLAAAPVMRTWHIASKDTGAEHGVWAGKDAASAIQTMMLASDIECTMANAWRVLEDFEMTELVEIQEVSECATPE